MIHIIKTLKVKLTFVVLNQNSAARGEFKGNINVHETLVDGLECVDLSFGPHLLHRVQKDL